MLYKKGNKKGATCKIPKSLLPSVFHQDWIFEGYNMN